MQYESKLGPAERYNHQSHQNLPDYCVKTNLFWASGAPRSVPVSMIPATRTDMPRLTDLDRIPDSPYGTWNVGSKCDANTLVFAAAIE